MEIKTNITKITDEGPVIRGEKLSNYIEGSFTDTIFQLLQNRKPTEKESKLFGAMLISIVDHGAGTTSSLTSRLVMSGGNSLNTAVGAGILAQGDYHGGAIEKCMYMLKSVRHNVIPVEAFVKRMVQDKKIIFGLGHRVYKDKDPRVRLLLDLCHKIEYRSGYLETLFDMERILEEVKGKKLIVNIDGFIAAILLEMRFSPETGKGIFLIGRAPGLVAQALEEKGEKKVRRLEEDNIKYIE